MKKKFKVLVVAMLLCNLAFLKSYSQSTEITPFGGYTFADDFDLYGGGYARIGDGATWGIMLTRNLNPHASVELVYSHLETTGEYNAFDYYSGYSISDYDIPMTVSYIQLGFCSVKPLGASGKAEGYGGIDLGVVVVSPNDERVSYDDAVRFAPGFKLGTKIWASPKVGFRLQANLEVPIQTAGVSIYAGSSGSGAGVSGFSTITQFGFTGGLILRLGGQ